LIGRCFGGWPTSSLRTQEPIIPGVNCWQRCLRPCWNDEPRRMGRCVRRDDASGFKISTTADTTSRSRGLIRPRFAIKFPYPPIRGRRECRAPDAPAAACAMIVVERTRVSQVTPESPGIPRAMVLRFPSCSPRRSGSFATVTCGIASTGLTPASRCQDHTTSPYASCIARLARRCVHRIPPLRP